MKPTLGSFHARARRTSRIMSLAVGLGSIVACTLLVDRRTEQCASDADCLSLGQNLTCVQSSCVAPLPKSDGPAAECATNAECIDRFFGEPAICNKTTFRCLELKKADICPFVVPPDELKNDNVVLFGAFMPTKAQGPLTQPIALAYQLALTELNEAGGLPGNGGPRRPLAAIFCDSDPQRSEAGIRHLVETVGVGALLALFPQDAMTRYIQDITVPAGVFTLNPGETTEALKNRNVERLVWHLLGTPEDIAVAYKPLLTRTEAYVRSRLGGTTQPLNVAVVTTKSLQEESIDSVIRSDAAGIVVNGVSAQVNETNGHLLRLSITSFDSDPKATFGVAVDTLAKFKPDIVVLLTAGEIGTIVPNLEKKLAESDGGVATLPVYVMSTRNARVSGVLAYLATDEYEPSTAKRKRFLGIQYAGAAEAEQKTEFLKRMKDEWPPEIDPVSYAATENFYDAVYWLAFGLYAAGPAAPATGNSFQEGVRKLLSGPRIYPGAVATLADSFLALTTAGSATFVGALGPPDIDSAKGTWRSVGGVYCYPPGATVMPAYDQLRYVRDTKTLVGDFGCFIGF